MRHNLTYKQKFLQKLALTPQMKQSIKLLGMSTKDLHEFIDAAIEANPFLKKDLAVKESRLHKKTLSAGGVSAADDDYMAGIRQEDNPRLALISQIKMSGLEGKVLEAAEYLIYEMDDNGYIKVELEEVADAILADIDEVTEALKAVQGLEPAGIGARDITECLKLQLERMKKSKSLEYTIVTEFTSELARNELEGIAKALDTGVENVQNAISVIKKLNPRPGSTMLSEKAKSIIPDLIAVIKGKKVSIEFNRAWMPSLEFYNPYENQPQVSEDPQSLKFIKDNMAYAKQLIDDLNKREKTIYKVADYILRFQVHAFGSATDDIKSLAIKDVAAALGLHKSTISRVVTNKYIQINNKVFSFKSLLSKSLARDDGRLISKAAVMKQIEALIDKEDKARPLSDQRIKEILEKDGIPIQRRLVAKYRNLLRILPVSLRRRKEPPSKKL